MGKATVGGKSITFGEWKMTTTPDTTTPARFAWEALSRGAPVYEVLDWLREQMGTDDVGAVKGALYGAAAEHIGVFGSERQVHGKPWRDSSTYTTDACREIERGAFDAADSAVSWLTEIYTDPERERNSDNPYMHWCCEFIRVLALCRAIEAA